MLEKAFPLFPGLILGLSLRIYENRAHHLEKSPLVNWRLPKYLLCNTDRHTGEEYDEEQDEVP